MQDSLRYPLPPGRLQRASCSNFPSRDSGLTVQPLPIIYNVASKASEINYVSGNKILGMRLGARETNLECSRGRLSVPEQPGSVEGEPVSAGPWEEKVFVNN